MTERPLVADAILGRLARWLRALGRYVVYDETLDDRDLLRRADPRPQAPGRTAPGRNRFVQAERPRGPPAVERSLPSEVRGDPHVRSAWFRRRPTCERVYWDGSHTRRMQRWLERIAVETSGA